MTTRISTLAPPCSSKGARPATSLRRGGLQHQLLNGPLPPSPSRAAICPVRLPSRQAVQRRRCELRRGGAVRATLLTPALIPVITKALLSAGAVAWVRFSGVLGGGGFSALMLLGSCAAAVDDAQRTGTFPPAS